MDKQVSDRRPLRVLIEMRAALDKHAGIPQQTRLLFRGLSLLDGVRLEGLIQSSTHSLTSGLPGGLDERERLPRDRQIDRLARIVIMLEQKFLRSHLSVIPMMLRRMIGRCEKLTRFDPQPFSDFIWRRLFARSLPVDDFNVVTKAGYRITNTPWTTMHIGGLISKDFGGALFPRLDTKDFDVMIAETPYPATIAQRTQLVIRYHDAIPLLLPHTISDRRYHQGSHYQALRRNVTGGAWFVCVSDATRKDLLTVFPQAESRSITIHNIVSHDYFDEDSSPVQVPEIIKARLNHRTHRKIDRSHLEAIYDSAKDAGVLKYLLVVSTVEPRKNHLSLLSAWERLRTRQCPQLKLIVVGSLGWHHTSITRKFRPWLERGEAFMLEDVPSPELRLLYKHARATVCPSFAEGFDLSGVEAMKSGGVVLASDIPVHREVYADGVEYFNPYSVEDLVHAISTAIDTSRTALREEMIRRGRIISRRYEFSEIMPQWQEFLSAVAARSPRIAGHAHIPSSPPDLIELRS